MRDDRRYTPRWLLILVDAALLLAGIAFWVAIIRHFFL